MPGMYIEIIETDMQLAEAMEKELLKEANRLLNSSFLDNIMAKIKVQIIALLTSAPEAVALSGGDLASHFGFPRGAGPGNVSDVVNKIADSIAYTKSKTDVTFTIGDANFTDVLSLASASIVTEKGDTLPWLNWLLLDGDKIIINQFSIKFESGKGRSGSAIMIDNTTGFWKVPAQYAGVIDDNWITRAITNQINMISSLIEGEINRVL